MNPAIASSILIVNPDKTKLDSFGADIVKDFDEAQKQGSHYKVVVFPYLEKNDKQWQTFVSHLETEMPQATRIIFSPTQDLKKIQKIINHGKAFRLLPNISSQDFETVVQKALSHHAEKQQESDLASLTQEENENLKQLSKELERLVEKKEKNLQKAKKRMQTINRQTEALHEALIAVHRANSVSEIETLLLKALKKTLKLEWIRIFFHDIDQIESQLSRSPELSTLKAPLTYSSQIIFARKSEKNFSRQEEDFLHQIAEGVSLAVDRLTKLEQAENLKRQWESTFDAISEPLCLTDDQFKIIRANAAFCNETHLSFKQLIGLNGFQAFAGKNHPAKVIDAGSTFKIQKATQNHPGNIKVFEVTTQKIQNKLNSPPILLILFRNITEQEKLEKQIFESSKMAELGTISSSIAHELNNPLGGMLSFLQLILSDLKDESETKEDILEMKKAALRCKDIIENLLGFSRKQGLSEKEKIDLREITLQALKIVELQTRSLGIEVEVNLPPKSAHFMGEANLLAQAISHIFQNAYEAVVEKLTENPRFKGHIKVELLSFDGGYFINIRDNGVGINPENQSKVFNPLFSTKGSKRNPGLGLTLSYQIINDHGGQLEVSSQPKIGTQVKISLSNV